MNTRSLIFVLALSASFYFINNFLFPPKYITLPVPVENTAVETPPKKISSHSDLKEQLYVIENEYQQLVFSNLGGSLAEINLPIQSEKNPLSVVKRIEEDRILDSRYSPFNHFPKKPYVSSTGSFQTTTIGGYYPLLRRDLPTYPHGLSIISDDSDLALMPFEVKRLEKNLIELEGKDQYRKITKTISFPTDSIHAPYCFDVTIKIEGDPRNLWLTTGVPEVEMISGSAAPTLKYRTTKNNRSNVVQLDLPKDSQAFNANQPDWICNSNGFLGLIIDPLNGSKQGFRFSQVPGQIAPSRLSLIDTDYALHPVDKYPGYEMQIPLASNSEIINFRVFAGPFATDVLKKVDTTYENPKIGYNPDFKACQSFHGWFAFITEPFAKFLFFLMNIFHSVTHSWGISIILLKVALRLMLYPLNAWSLKSTAKMQKIAPKVAALQEKYKKDPKRVQLETIGLYRQEGVNPLGGCLPLLIQMPFLIGMFDLLKSTFELRGASFIPGWIDNLTAPDVVFNWGYPVWFFGNSLHLLPFVLGGVMFLQQQMASTAPKNANQMSDQQRQQRLMGNVMVIVFTVLFYHFPSGLNIYWLSSMLLGILQQWWITKKVVLKKRH